MDPLDAFAKSDPAELKYLEHQYSPSKWSKLTSPEEIITDHCKKTLEASENARKTTKTKLNVKYGPLDGQQLDMFFPADYQESKKDVPLLMFIHGGYWQELGKEYYSFIGEVFCRFGMVVSVVGYDLAPKVKMATIVKEIQESVVYLCKTFANTKLFIAGHSAGGHLAAMLLKEDWTALGLPRFPIQGIIPISGVYNLEPLVPTYVNEALKMDNEEAKRFSPMHFIDDIKMNSDCKVLILIGEYESDEFHKQSREFCQVSQNAGCDASLEVISNTDHFSVIHDFINDGYKGTEIIKSFVEEAMQGKTSS